MIRFSHWLAAAAAGLCSLTLPACSSRDAAPTEAVGSTSQAYDTNTDLISPATCTLRSSHLVNCAIATRQLSGLPLASTAVPLRTTFTSQKTGNCSTQYPLQVKLSADSAADVTFQYLSNASAAVRRADGQPMPTITLTDTSPWTKSAAFDGSCKISFTISSNEVDVDTSDQAKAIIANLQADLNAKTSVAAHYQALTLYNSAFLFLQTVANNFLIELTNDTIQDLRAHATNATTAIANLLGSASCSGAMNPDGTPLLSADDQNNLITLLIDLPAVGQATDWQNADGSTKTLADLLGPDQAKVLATVQKLAAQTDGGMNFGADYATAEQAVVAAQAKLDQARVQLAKWL